MIQAGHNCPFSVFFLHFYKVTETSCTSVFILYISFSLIFLLLKICVFMVFCFFLLRLFPSVWVQSSRNILDQNQDCPGPGSVFMSSQISWVWRSLSGPSVEPGLLLDLADMHCWRVTRFWRGPRESSGLKRILPHMMRTRLPSAAAERLIWDQRPKWALCSEWRLGILRGIYILTVLLSDSRSGSGHLSSRTPEASAGSEWEIICESRELKSSTGDYQSCKQF